ncbi:MAG: hypothetical protein KDB80_09570 [Planctomycetes bacterium]|nr:hypothetical protein [Planctomycetota bacterium]
MPDYPERFEADNYAAGGCFASAGLFLLGSIGIGSMHRFGAFAAAIRPMLWLALVVAVILFHCWFLAHARRRRLPRSPTGTTIARNRRRRVIQSWLGVLATALGLVLVVFKVDIIDAAGEDWIVLIMLLSLLIAFAILMSIRGKLALDSPDDSAAERRLYTKHLWPIGLVALLASASVTRVPIAAYVFRNEDELLVECSRHRMFQDRGRHVVRAWGWVDELVIVYAPDGPGPEIVIEGHRPRRLFGPWYYAIDD